MFCRMAGYIEKTLETVKARNHNEPLFLQAIEEVLGTFDRVVGEHPEIEEKNILERLCEPERQIIFRICWQDDEGNARVNRGFRIHFSSVLGPYKGGLRFHPTVSVDVVKFLAFEQIFKNSLTGLQLGAGKGGADFNPKGKSDAEIMRFCQSFMTELSKHIGSRTDVPAGDIGVSSREIGYLFGQYKKIVGRYELGVLTGKDIGWGGSLGRKEATGFGVVYFAREMLKEADESIEGKTCVVSGAGNVALYAIRKLQDLGAKVVACSDSHGVIYDEAGLDLDCLRMVKEVERRPLTDYAEARPRSEFRKDAKPWDIPCDLAFPCATQNELEGKDAKALLSNGCKLVCEGANMPCTPEAIEAFSDAGIFYGPGKAANAGGVAVSALEMQQNAGWESWSFDDVDQRLQGIMADIHRTCRHYARKYSDERDYVTGANVGGFLRVAQAMQALGIV